MKKDLIDLIIYPACLPREVSLKSVIHESEGNDIVSGRLSCPACSGSYYIFAIKSVYDMFF